MTISSDIAQIRAFNRDYTKRIGLLLEQPYGGEFNLTEARVLYELAHCESTRPSVLAAELGLDRAYLSRILQRFRKRRLIRSRPADDDGRSVLISLTKTGRRAFEPVNKVSEDVIRDQLLALEPRERARCLQGAKAIQQAFGKHDRQPASSHLRQLAVGDIGWITHRQARLYHEEYGWDEQFEGLVAQILGEFVRDFDEEYDASWIAELNGSVVGSVFLVRGRQANTAKLRLLYVEPSARGHGIGSKLVRACVTGARARGYAALELWTNDILSAARHIYQRFGFQLVEEEKHSSFGKDLVGQTWLLDLR